MATTNKTKKTTKAAKQAVETGREQFETAIKASTEAASQNFEKSYTFSKKQFEEAVKGMDDLTSFQKENVEAVIASGNAAAKGVEKMNAEFVAFSKKSVEDGMAAFKALSGAKNVREYFDIQNALVRDSYDSMVSEAGKFSEMAMKVANEVMEPVSARMAVAMEQIGRPNAG